MAGNVATFEGLLSALIQQESSGNPKAVSDTGHIGLMQINPVDSMERLRTGVPSVFEAAELLGKDVGRRTVEDSKRLLEDPDVNRLVGIPYLRELMSKYNWNILDALTAYNAGPDLLDRTLASGGGYEDLPKAEQRTYAKDVAEEFRNAQGFDLPNFGVLVSPRPRSRPQGLLDM
jgi:soluble lytic murein transglycosylase-like protein